MMGFNQYGVFEQMEITRTFETLNDLWQFITFCATTSVSSRYRSLFLFIQCSVIFPDDVVEIGAIMTILDIHKVSVSRLCLV